jgi:hypothetical protein
LFHPQEPPISPPIFHLILSLCSQQIGVSFDTNPLFCELSDPDGLGLLCSRPGIWESSCSQKRCFSCCCYCRRRCWGSGCVLSSAMVQEVCHFSYTQWHTDYGEGYVDEWRSSWAWDEYYSWQSTVWRNLPGHLLCHVDFLLRETANGDPQADSIKHTNDYQLQASQVPTHLALWCCIV